MGSGYEYHYRVSINDEVKQDRVHLSRRTFLLEIRTQFTIKSTGAGVEEDIQLIGTERFGGRFTIDDDHLSDPPEVSNSSSWGDTLVDFHVRLRLSEYCMPDDRIRDVARTAFDYAHRLAADSRYDFFRTIPVLLSIDVCTVQMEGEALDDTIRRSVKPDFLIPLHLLPVNTFMSEDTVVDLGLRCFLISLPVVRVTGDDEEDGGFETCPVCLPGARVRSLDSKNAFHRGHCVGCKEGLALMEVCSICLCRPIVGDQIASLPCKHSFHNHCVVRWLLNKKSCPLCRMEIVTYRGC